MESAYDCFVRCTWNVCTKSKSKRSCVHRERSLNHHITSMPILQRERERERELSHDNLAKKVRSCLLVFAVTWLRLCFGERSRDDRGSIRCKGHALRNFVPEDCGHLLPRFHTFSFSFSLPHSLFLLCYTAEKLASRYLFHKDYKTIFPWRRKCDTKLFDSRDKMLQRSWNICSF